MLEEAIMKDFGNEEDYNCAEKILCGANEVYGLGLSKEVCKLSAVFGGGMGTGRTCGAVISALMVLGYLNTETVAHQSPEVKAMAIKYQEQFISRMGSVDCSYLKENHFDETEGCKRIIVEAARVLDEFVDMKKPNR